MAEKQESIIRVKTTSVLQLFRASDNSLTMNKLFNTALLQRKRCEIHNTISLRRLWTAAETEWRQDMKKYRIRENSIADKTVRLFNKINTEPFASIILFLFAMGMGALFDIVIISTYTVA